MRDFDPRVTALARSKSNCTSKLPTNPIVRGGAPYQETRNRLGHGTQMGSRHQDRLAD
jgi:hypothetical protein